MSRDTYDFRELPESLFYPQHYPLAESIPSYRLATSFSIADDRYVIYNPIIWNKQTTTDAGKGDKYNLYLCNTFVGFAEVWKQVVDAMTVDTDVRCSASRLFFEILSTNSIARHPTYAEAFACTRKFHEAVLNYIFRYKKIPPVRVIINAINGIVRKY